jgi:hypothetical protein
LRALGPRLQPVTYATGAGDLSRVRGREGDWGPRVRPLALRYALGLGGEHAERYWLLLPPRAADGLETLGTGTDAVAGSMSPPA